MFSCLTCCAVIEWSQAEHIERDHGGDVLMLVLPHVVGLATLKINLVFTLLGVDQEED